MDNSRVINAVKRYLALRGYEVLGEIGDADTNIIVASEDNTITFCNIFVIEGGRKSGVDMSRDAFDEMIFNWLAHHDVADVAICYDIIEIHVVNNDRALIKHIVNADNMLDER